MDYRIEQLRYLLREDPSSRIFYQLGELLRREGEPDQAVQVLRDGLERHPRYVAAWVSLGRSLVDLTALSEAGEAFEKALEIDRDNPVAARLIGETAVGRQDWLRAVKAFKLVRALTGSDAQLDARIALVEGHLEERGELEAPKAADARTKKTPPRAFEVVSLSSDDPFAETTDEPPVWQVESDVFEIVEPSKLAAATDADAELGAAAAPSTDDQTAPVDEPAAVPIADDAETDQAAVGAWASPSRWIGVAANRAWIEPSDDLGIAVDATDRDLPWTTPVAAAPADLALEAPEPEAAPVVAGTVSPDRPDESTAAAAAAESLPGEHRAPDGDALTRPIPVSALMIEPEVAAPTDEEPRVATDGPGPKSVSDGEGRRHELDHGMPLPTMTLARLALAQNDRSLAMATLESLIERNPHHAEAADLLEELRSVEASAMRNQGRARLATAKISALQGWLDAVRLASERRVQ